MPEIIDLLSSPELPPLKPSTLPKPLPLDIDDYDFSDNPFLSSDDDNHDALKAARDVGRPGDPSEPAAKKRRLSKTSVVATTQNDRQECSTSFGATGRSRSPQARRPRASEPIELGSSSPIRNVEEEKRQPAGRGGQVSFDLDLDMDINPFESSSPKHATRRAPSPQAMAPWDPISSSARQESTRKRAVSVSALPRSRADVVNLFDSSDDDDDEEDEVGKIASSSDDEFPEIHKLTSKPPRKAASGTKKASRTKSTQGGTGTAKSTKTKSTKSAAEKALGKEQKAQEKEKKAAEREAEKKRKQQEKDRVRADKAQEKERAAALAEVNKLKTDKKAAVPEMIVRLPDSLGTAMLVQAKKLLGDISVQCDDWHSPVANVVTWRRKVRAVYNERLDHYEPVPPRVDDETYAVVMLPAADLVKLALGGQGRSADGDDHDDKSTLDAHVADMKRHFPHHRLIYMIEGLTAWLRKNKNLRNRQFTSAVRTGLGDAAAAEPPASSQNGRRRKKKAAAAAPTEYVSEDIVEDALMDLQMHGMLVHRAENGLEAARWVVVFTEQISTAPYRRRKQEATAGGEGGSNFCMDAGQVRTGDGPLDTYVRMLQEVVRVTTPVAYSVAAKYSTLPALVRAFDVRGPLMLQDLRKSANKDGAFTDRAVGPAISRRLHKVFTCEDETSTDI